MDIVIMGMGVETMCMPMFRIKMEVDIIPIIATIIII